MTDQMQERGWQMSDIGASGGVLSRLGLRWSQGERRRQRGRAMRFTVSLSASTHLSVCLQERISLTGHRAWARLQSQW